MDNIIDKFLKEDMLIVKPSVFIYIDKEQSQNVFNHGIKLNKDFISCYLTRLPEDVYEDFLGTVVPVRITLSRLKKIKNQKIKLIAKNIAGVDEIPIDRDDIITKLQKKYGSYLDVCYRDKIPLEDLPRIDLYLSKCFVPGFVCKILNV